MMQLRIIRLSDNQLEEKYPLSDESINFTLDEELKAIEVFYKNGMIALYPLTHFYFKIDFIDGKLQDKTNQ